MAVQRRCGRVRQLMVCELSGRGAARAARPARVRRVGGVPRAVRPKLAHALERYSVLIRVLQGVRRYVASPRFVDSERRLYTLLDRSRELHSEQNSKLLLQLLLLVSLLLSN